jgi:hypothetical protein
MGGDFEMFDNGVLPDEEAGDLQYTFEIQGLNLVQPGIYTINVTVYDLSGASSTLSTQLEIISEGTANYTAGKSKSTDPELIIGGIVVVVLIVAVLIIILFSRSKKRSRNAAPPPTFRPVTPNPYAQYQTGHPQSQSDQRNY